MENWLKPIITISLLLLCLGCKDEKTIPPKNVSPTPASTVSGLPPQANTHEVTFSDKDVTAGRDLAKLLQSETCPEVSTFDNPAPIFWVALNAPEAARVKALLRMCEFSYLERIEWVNEDFESIVVAGLHAKEKSVRYGALRAAEGVMGHRDPDKDFLENLVKLGSDSELTYGTLLAFRYQDPPPGTTIHKFLLKALASERPEVVRQALVGLSSSDLLEVDQESRDTIWECLRHKSPFVRGFAAHTLAIYDRRPNSSERMSRLAVLMNAWLDEEDGYLVGEACKSLTYLRNSEAIEAIPKLARLLDDNRPASFKLKPEVAWEEELEIDFNTYATVGSMAESAIIDLSLEVPGPGVPGATDWLYDPDSPPDLSPESKNAAKERRKAVKRWLAEYAKSTE